VEFAFCHYICTHYYCFYLMIKLFVGGFPLDITEMELVMLISPHGDVSTIKIVRDKKTGNCKGYAFVEMADKDGAERAVEALDGTSIGDRVLSVKITVEKPTPVKKPFSKFSSNNFSPNPSYSNYSKVERKGEEVKKKRPRKQF
jgi:RNA recognition motif-containing protein